MKKIYSLSTFLMLGIFTLAQTPIITAIADGDCSGGTPKVLEIFANGTVDFTQFSLENQTNANTDWGNAQSLADFGTVTDGFVYVYVDGTNPEIFGTEFPSAVATLESNTVNINGNDRVRIINTSTSAVIDIYGADGVDGTGTAWEYKDGYAKRNNGTTADGTFVESNWTFNNGALDGGGSCQGGDTFETIMGGIGTYIKNDLGINNINANRVNMTTVWNQTANFNVKGNATVQIFNMNGQLVQTAKGSNNFTVNVNSLTQGVYVVKVTVDGKSTVKKVVKK